MARHRADDVHELSQAVPVQKLGHELLLLDALLDSE